MDMDQFISFVKEALKATCGSNRLPGLDPIKTNAFGQVLAENWAKDGVQGDLGNVYTEMTSNKETGAESQTPSTWVDVLVVRHNGEQSDPTTLLVAKIEPSNYHITALPDHKELDGYFGDFTQLLLFNRAPKCLFVAAVPTEHVDELRETVCLAYKKAGLSVRHGITAVVLLPVDKTEITEVWLAARGESPEWHQTRLGASGAHRMT